MRHETVRSGGALGGTRCVERETNVSLSRHIESSNEGGVDGTPSLPRATASHERRVSLRRDESRSRSRLRERVESHSFEGGGGVERCVICMVSLRPKKRRRVCLFDTMSRESSLACGSASLAPTSSTPVTGTSRATMRASARRACGPQKEATQIDARVAALSSICDARTSLAVDPSSIMPLSLTGDGGAASRMRSRGLGATVHTDTCAASQ